MLQLRRFCILPRSKDMIDEVPYRGYTVKPVVFFNQNAFLA
jgi:hypothetical protein